MADNCLCFQVTPLNLGSKIDLKRLVEKKFCNNTFFPSALEILILASRQIQMTTFLVSFFFVSFQANSFWYWHVVPTCVSICSIYLSNFKKVSINTYFLKPWLYIVLLSPMQLWHTMANLLDILRRDFLPSEISTWTFFSNTSIQLWET